jgi:23S rRNA (uracil1939-C5)-methyltransferase
MTERLVIDRIGHRGDGAAETPHGPIFVPYTLPGEVVELEAVPGHPDRRQLLRIHTPSAARIAPICPHFGICGGCAIQHWERSHYLAWKRTLVTDALAQAGLSAPVDEVVDAHGAGRRRIVLHARHSGKTLLEVGFAALRAHRLVAIDRCPVLAPALNGAIATAWEIAETLAPLRKPLDIQFTATDVGIDIDVRGSGPVPPSRTAALARLAEKRGLARLTRHGELILQRVVPTLRIGRAVVPLPSGAFLQATAQGEEELARLVAQHVGGAKNIADLFAGAGAFALRLAERSRVLAADSSEAAIAALRRGAATASGLKPLDAEVRDLFRRPYLKPELNRFDAVVFDPPRQGAEAQARALAESTVRTVVAVSCNPATFARDAAILIGGGYRLMCVTPVDQFRHAAHVELVAKFER